MTVAKVVELIGTSPNSWQDAVNNAVTEAAETIENIHGVEVLNWTADVENGRVVQYRADVKIAFKVER